MQQRVSWPAGLGVAETTPVAVQVAVAVKLTALGVNGRTIASWIARHWVSTVTFMFLAGAAVRQVMLSETRTWPAAIAQPPAATAHEQAQLTMPVVVV